VDRTSAPSCPEAWGRRAAVSTWPFGPCPRSGREDGIEETGHVGQGEHAGNATVNYCEAFGVPQDATTDEVNVGAEFGDTSRCRVRPGRGKGSQSEAT